MNQKAKELGLSNTNFVTPHGLDEDAHYTSAYELAVITDYALKNEKFATIVNTKTCQITINGQSRDLSNTNELLGNLNGVNGVKTGFTNGAGRCLVTSTKRNGHQIICVVLGADTKKIRTTDSVKLIEYAFANYEYINVKEKVQNEFERWLSKNAQNIQYHKAKEEQIQYELEKNEITWIPVLKNKEKDIKINVNYNNNFTAPIEKGKVIGTIQVTLEEDILFSSDILLKEKITKKQVGDYFKDFITQHQKYLFDSMKEIMIIH